MIKQTFTWILASCAILLIAGCESSPPAPPEPVTLTDEETIEATVVAVDLASSAVTLRGPDGQEGTLVVPEARIYAFSALLQLLEAEPGRDGLSRRELRRLAGCCYRLAMYCHCHLIVKCQCLSPHTRFHLQQDL